MDSYDAEKLGAHTTVEADIGSDHIQEYNGTVVKQDNGIFSKLRSLEDALDRKLGVESQAISRVLPEDKQPQPWHSQAVMALLWASGTMQISCFATGFLGPEFGLDFTQSVCITILGTLLGACVTGFCATMGPGMGLRQVSISRYSFGWYPSKLVALLNILTQIGWGAVGCITGGQALTAVSNGHVSVVLGVLIIALGSCAISFFGLRAILHLDKYAWFVFLVLFLVMYGETAHFADTHTPSSFSGITLSGNMLSIFAITYGSSASWCSIASDYYVHYPVDTSKLKVFVLTTLGVTIPTCLGMVLGICAGSAMYGPKPDWLTTYDKDGIGYLIQTMTHPIGFSKFLLVVLVLADICNNVINIYSTALSIQQLARPIAVVPRFFWTLIVTGVIIALALAGKDKLLTVLQDLLSLLGYWETCYFVIVATEHFMFRGGKISNYNLDAWSTPEKLPLGLAGITAFLIGCVGWIMGMVTTWYIGPIAKKIGEYGGDVANELALVFTLIAYIPLRKLELKKFGR